MHITWKLKIKIIRKDNVDSLKKKIIKWSEFRFIGNKIHFGCFLFQKNTTIQIVEITINSLFSWIQLSKFTSIEKIRSIGFNVLIFREKKD